jgi:hypothetical protein
VGGDALFPSVAVLDFRRPSNSPSSASNGLQPLDDLKKFPKDFFHGAVGILCASRESGELPIAPVTDLGKLPGTLTAGCSRTGVERECADGQTRAGDDVAGAGDCANA